MRRVLVLVILLAGCASPAALPAQGPHHAFLDGQGRLVADAPDAGSVRAGSFFASWASGTDYPTWRTEPFAADALVTNLTVEAVFRATAPVTTSARFPDLMAYGGSGDAWDAFNSTAVAPALQPGETHRVTIRMVPPTGGLWVPAGERLGVKLVPVMTQGQPNDIEFLVGANGSTLQWDESPAGFSTRPAAAPTQANGEATGSAYAGAAAPATTFQRFPVPLHHPAYLVAWMNVSAAQGVPDVDLFLEDAQGKQIAGSGTPTPREMLRLAPDNLPAEGDVTLVVASYGSAHATFTLTWVVGEAPSVASSAPG